MTERLGRACAALACLAALSAPGAAAQDAPAGIRLAAGTGATSLHGGASAIASGSALLGVWPRVLVGASGTILPETRRIDGPTPASDQLLRVAYGGLALQFLVADRPGRSLWLRLVTGVGNAKVDLAAVRTRIAADNFGVLVPEIGADASLHGPLRAGASLGYRAVFAVDDLPGVAPADLRGPTGTIYLSFHHF